MKKNYVVLIIIISLFFTFKTSNVKGQDAYYYFQDSAIHLFQNSSIIIMFFKADFAHKNNDTTYSKSANIFEYLIPAYDDIDTLVTIIHTYYPIIDLEMFLDTLDISISDLKGFSFGFRVNNNNLFLPTMEVAFRFNEFGDTTDLRFQNLVGDYDAVFLKSSYNVYYYYVPTYEVFDFANNLYDLGIVMYAEPNHYAEYFFDLDPLFSYQYYLHNTGQTIDGISGTADIDIDAPESWTITKGSDGVDLNPVHPDMQGSVIEGWTPNCISNCDGRPRTSHMHGEAIAGVIYKF